MNLFQLVCKNMRQRALSTWLTTISVMLGVGLAVAIIVMGRETDALFGQRNYGYDVLVGIRGSGLQLTLNTVYHLDKSQGNIPFTWYGRLTDPTDLGKYVDIAMPTVVGDYLQGKYPVVGTLPQLFGYDDDGKPIPTDQQMEYKVGERYSIAEGHIFSSHRFEAILGSEIPSLAGLKVGDTFQVYHGMPQPGETPDIHREVWKVVGVLAPTHTSSDKVVYIPINSFYTIAEHGVGLVAQQQIRAGELPTASSGVDLDDIPPKIDPDGTKHYPNYDLTPDGNIKLHPDLVDKLAVSAIMVKSKGGVSAPSLLYYFQSSPEAMACNPAETMRGFFDTFLKPMKYMILLICSLVTIVAAVGILVSIYNSVSARVREIAILRALGATRERIVALICAEAGLVALIGGILGIVLGHAIVWRCSEIMYQDFGQRLQWYLLDWTEPAYVAGVIILALIAGLAPALKAYRTPVATNLTTG